MSNIAAVRRLKDKLAKEKPKLLEVRKGDIVINPQGLVMVVVSTTDETETLKETVAYVEQMFPQEGKKTMTYDRLRKMHKRGNYTVHRGPAWSDDDAVDSI